MEKKALSPVVAVVLLLVVTVSAAVGFQQWYNQYSSSILSEVENEDSIADLKILDWIGDVIYVQGPVGKNISYISIKDNEGAEICTLENVSFVSALNLIGWWNFDNANTTHVASKINESTATLVKFENGAARGVGYLNYSISLDGTNDYLHALDDDTWDVGTSDFSGCGWIKNTDTETDLIFSKRFFSNSGWAFFKVNDYLQFVLDDGPESNYNSSTNADLVADQWNHVCFTADRDENVTFYLNTEVIGTADITGHPGDLSNSHRFCIGANSCVVSTGYYFDGDIDELMLFRKKLSESEITNLYNFRTFTNSTMTIGTTVCSSITRGQKYEVFMYTNEGKMISSELIAR